MSRPHSPRIAATIAARVVAQASAGSVPRRYSSVRSEAALVGPGAKRARRVERREAARFLLDYVEALARFHGAGPRMAAGRVKQLARYWTAGGLFADERGAILAMEDVHLLERVAREAGETEWTLPAAGPLVHAAGRAEPSPACVPVP